MPITCEIVTQDRLVYSAEVDFISLPGIEGRLGILPNHSPLLTALDFGEVYVRQNGEEEYFAVGGGFAEVQPDKVIVLADSAERADEINLDAAEAARERARKMMAEGVPDDPVRYQQIEAALRKAQLSINVGMRRSARRRRPPTFDVNNREENE